MDYREKFEELVREEPKEVYVDFLRTLKNLFLDYLSGKIDDLTVSEITGLWYASYDKFSDGLIKINYKIKDLRAAMDITHPDFSNERKRKIIKELIRRVDEMLED